MKTAKIQYRKWIKSTGGWSKMIYTKLVEFKTIAEIERDYNNLQTYMIVDFELLPIDPVYPKHNMCKPQPVQLDCRVTTCRFYKGGGTCSHHAPEITLHIFPKGDTDFNCGSREDK